MSAGGDRLRQDEATCRRIVDNAANLGIGREEAQQIQQQAALYSIGAEVVDALAELREAVDRVGLSVMNVHDKLEHRL
jgi:hypothetical protein